jgi:hypothetical protein
MREGVVVDEATRTKEALSVTLLTKELEYLIERKARCIEQIAVYKSKISAHQTELTTMELAEEDLRTAIDQLVTIRTSRKD